MTRSAHLFRVYEIDHGGTEWVVACDRDHAYEILVRCYGGDPAGDADETVPEFKERAMRPLAVWERLTLSDDIHDWASPKRTKTAAAWVAQNGPGALATTEA